jgi:hypothetical protein
VREGSDFLTKVGCPPVRQAVARFAALGPFPDEGADGSEIERHEQLLAGIEPPLSGDEAALLLSSSARTIATASPGRCSI